MSEKLRIGVLGLTHDHVWAEVAAASECQSAELVAAADPNEPLTERFTETYGCRVYEDATSLLKNEKLDAAYVFGSNLEGSHMAIEAMELGLHILIEKPLAANLDDANQMLVAARTNNVQLVVNWPFTWWPQLQHAVKLVEDGKIGNLHSVTYRAAHCGPEALGCSEYFCDWLFDERRNGAGAMMDYCCYGAVLAVALMGMPESVVGMAGGKAKDFLSVEDSGIIAMKYPQGLATATASWTQIGNLTSYDTAIYGSEGTLFAEPGDSGKLYLATNDDPNGSEVSIPKPELGMRDSAHNFVEVVTGQRDPFILSRDDYSRDAQEILEAGIRSAKLAEQIKLPFAG
tara:strand:+ start:192 stop:1223 length:1032 start_codon:yes stop_codon:yes gene_type:complete